MITVLFWLRWDKGFRRADAAEAVFFWLLALVPAPASGADYSEDNNLSFLHSTNEPARN